jgi:hypothetical protein
MFSFLSPSFCTSFILLFPFLYLMPIYFFILLFVGWLYRKITLTTSPSASFGRQWFECLKRSRER